MFGIHAYHPGHRSQPRNGVASCAAAPSPPPACAPGVPFDGRLRAATPAASPAPVVRPQRPVAAVAQVPQPLWPPRTVEGVTAPLSPAEMAAMGQIDAWLHEAMRPFC
jgi:hypothetical protein